MSAATEGVSGGRRVMDTSGCGQQDHGMAQVDVVTEAVILLAHPGGVDRRFVPWLVAGLVSFGIATIIWALSATGRPLCDPNSLLQGHAVWHLLAMAVTPFCIFWYLRGETRA